MYALVVIGRILEWILQDCWREGQWEGATVKKKGEIVIIRLDFFFFLEKGRDGGQHWVL